MPDRSCQNWGPLASRIAGGKVSHALISSPMDPASILRMTLERCNFTVTSLMLRSKAICLLRRPCFAQDLALALC